MPGRCYPRHLSVKSDVLYAFSGVCNAASILKDTDMSPVTFSHFYGIRTHQYQSVLALEQFLQNMTWRVVYRSPISELLKHPLTFPTWSWASPKFRHQSLGLSGEYVEPPECEASPSDLKPRFISSSGVILESNSILRQGIESTGFYPHLLLDGALLKGLFRFTHESASKTGTAYLDS